jgi:hypothetical protein
MKIISSVDGPLLWSHQSSVQLFAVHPAWNVGATLKTSDSILAFPFSNGFVVYRSISSGDFFSSVLLSGSVDHV